MFSVNVLLTNISPKVELFQNCLIALYATLVFGVRFIIQEIWREKKKKHKTSALSASIWIGCVQDARKGYVALLRKIAFLPGSREKRTGGPPTVIEGVH